MTGSASKSVALLAIAGFLAACASEPPKEAAQPAAAVAQVSRPTPPPQSPPVARSVAQPVVPADPLRDPNSMLSKRSVFYAFDVYDVTPQYRPLVEAHAKYLHEHPATKATIQGNCDERGSREYNLALGQRRAERVRKMMLLLGASEAQTEAVSLGEEKPRAAGHDETSWAQNRRSDIVYEREK